jgi:predicted DNA-binding protein (MmcQ/YjbR family)
MTYNEYNAFCAALPATTYVMQWGGHHVWKVGGKVFCIGGGTDDAPAYSFKASEIAFMVLPERKGFRPAPYLASRGLKWIQAQGHEVDGKELRELIEASHRLVVAGLSRKIRRDLGIEGFSCMAKRHDEIGAKLKDFIVAQKIFFVATAGPEGRVNLSPKGLDGTLAVLGPRRVAFLNLTGSGNETAAHLRLNDRITLMFCAFSGAPMILRLYGRGRAIHPRDEGWCDLLAHFSDLPGKRQVVVVEIDEIMTSCGFGAPLMEFVGHRPTLPEWAERKGEDGIRAYWEEKNALSFDGLPTGVTVADA